MGGAAQRTWRHAVPKVSEAGPRLAVMFRPTWSAG
jgi:alkylated DNA repair dioxygenase AlkB